MKTEFIVVRTSSEIAVCEVEEGKTPTALRNGARYLVRIDKRFTSLADPGAYQRTLARAKTECMRLNAERLKPKKVQTQAEAERRWISEHPLGEKA